MKPRLFFVGRELKEPRHLGSLAGQGLGFRVQALGCRVGFWV